MRTTTPFGNSRYLIILYNVYVFHSTVVRVYAVESDLPDLKSNQYMQKIFIDEDDLCDILRKNLQGMEFAKEEIYQ